MTILDRLLGRTPRRDPDDVFLGAALDEITTLRRQLALSIEVTKQLQNELDGRLLDAIAPAAPTTEQVRAHLDRA